MNKVDQYVQAATRENTRRSYKSAVNHFEESWGGFLPATSDSIARYLADYAQTHSISTLRLRLAALSKWHQAQGFPDPTKAPLVKSVLKGIGELHPKPQKQAKPLQLNQLERIVQWQDSQISQGALDNNHKQVIRHSRDKALLLMGFWRAFRSDDLCRLSIESISITPGIGMEIFLARSKGDRTNKGRSYKVPALRRLCPVTAYQDWIHNSGLTEGPVFRGIHHTGQISDSALHVDSIVKILRGQLQAAGIKDHQSFSSHSLRRGFATWANENQWDLKTLMEYVGWKDVQSAMRYIDGPDAFYQERIERSLDAAPKKIPAA